MNIKLIAAMNLNRGIGYHTEIPWRDKEEFKHFRSTTSEGPVQNILLMGSVTADDLLRKFQPEEKVYSHECNAVFPNRRIIVLTRRDGHVRRRYVQHGFYVASSFTEALAIAQSIHELPLSGGTLFVCGGAEVYRAALESGEVQELILSTVYNDYPCDTFFPTFDLEAWEPPRTVDHHTFKVDYYLKRESP